MAGQIEAYQQLPEARINELHQLSQKCTEHDQFKLKVYWNIIEARSTERKNDIIYLIDGKIRGYMGLFHFVEKELEICCLVDPEFRNQGIFKALYQDAQQKIPDFGVAKVSFPCPRESNIAHHALASIGAKQTTSEYNMHLEDIDQYRKKYHRNIRLVRAKIEDIPTIAAIDNVCFNTEFEEMLHRYVSDLKSESRRIWLANKSKKTVGKIHVRFDEEGRAYIHDFCVAPQYQGKKYGSDILHKTLDYLISKNHRDINLDVKADNASAIKIYERTGFVIKQIHDYWKIDLR